MARAGIRVNGHRRPSHAVPEGSDYALCGVARAEVLALDNESPTCATCQRVRSAKRPGKCTLASPKGGPKKRWRYW